MAQNQPKIDSIKLIAHRGYPQCYPENSLIGIEAAIKSGVKFIEVDLQMSADHIPVVFHDVFLKRVTGKSGAIFSKKWEQLKEMSIGESRRFGTAFIDEKIPQLSELVSLMERWPDISLFLEIKRSSLMRFGMNRIFSKVIPLLKTIIDRVVVISYDTNLLMMFREQGAVRVGYILKSYNSSAKLWAERNKPEYLFCNRKKLSEEDSPLWIGNWQWILYEYGLDEIRGWIPENTSYIETNDIKSMLEFQNSV